jgi:hypothetical protein
MKKGNEVYESGTGNFYPPVVVRRAGRRAFQAQRTHMPTHHTNAGLSLPVRQALPSRGRSTSFTTFGKRY